MIGLQMDVLELIIQALEKSIFGNADFGTTEMISQEIRNRLLKGQVKDPVIQKEYKDGTLWAFKCVYHISANSFCP